MQRSKYAPDFKSEAVKQVVDKRHSVVDVARRLGISDNVLYTWVSKFKKADEPRASDLKAMQGFLPCMAFCRLECQLACVSSALMQYFFLQGTPKSRKHQVPGS